MLWHVHELIFGFAEAVVGGYLLTAIPDWMARLPVRGIVLKVLVLFWVMAWLVIAIAGRAASYHQSGDLRAGKGFVMGVPVIWITTRLPLTVPLFVGQLTGILIATAVIWFAGRAIFIAGFLPVLCGPVIRLVLSDRRHRITDATGIEAERSI